MSITAEQGPSAAMVVPKFFVMQRITLMVNRYEIHAPNADGTEGSFWPTSEQKHMKLEEEINFFADDTTSRRVFSIQGAAAARRPRRARRLRRERRRPRHVQQACCVAGCMAVALQSR